MKSIIYVNIAQTLRYGGNSGIQRVVRELYSRLDGYVIDNYVFEFGLLDASGWLSAKSYVPIEQDGHATLSIIKLLSIISHTLFPDYFYKLLRNTYQKFRRSKDLKGSFNLPKDSIVLEIDAGWVDESLFDGFDLKRIFLIYDVIPLLNPNFCTEEHVQTFSRWLASSLKSSVGVISISNSALSDIKTYASTALGIDNLPSDYFYLGGDFSVLNKLLQCNDLQVVSLAEQKYFIVVGTLEPRKNHINLIKAFESYRKNGGTWMLVIVGRAGWCCDEIIKSIKSSSFYGTGLHWFSNADDSVLSYLYSKSSCVISPSFAEGFGLPVVEGAVMGKPVIASDIAVYKELASDFAYFFDPDDSFALAELMGRAEAGELKVCELDQISCRVLDWNASSEFFIKAVLNVIKKIN